MGKADISTRNSRRKIHLVFDEKKRRDFLTGFHKRKLQRKKAAKEKLEKELKEEKRRLKQEAKESYKKLVASHRPIPELENLLSEEYEDDDVNVKVLELSSFALANQSNWIGPNQTRYELGDPDEGNDSEKESDEDCKVPGMELEEKKREKEDVTEKPSKQSFASEKDLKRSLKKQATKNVQDSKVFQLKNKMERQRQKKKSLRQKRLKYKVQEKHKKRRRK